jgi:5-methylcytosine-specific restriction endonuclease McrA
LAQRRRESAPISNTIILPPVPNKPNISQNQEPRKAIPKKIRGEAWKIQFGDSTKGSCFCCKKDLDVFDDWHAGHIVSHSNNGTDTANNLRPVCGSCNLSMGTENMDDFKKRCYPT